MITFKFEVISGHINLPLSLSVDTWLYLYVQYSNSPYTGDNITYFIATMPQLTSYRVAISYIKFRSLDQDNAIARVQRIAFGAKRTSATPIIKSITDVIELLEFTWRQSQR